MHILDTKEEVLNKRPWAL